MPVPGPGHGLDPARATVWTRSGTGPDTVRDEVRDRSGHGPGRGPGCCWYRPHGPGPVRDRVVRQGDEGTGFIASVSRLPAVLTWSDGALVPTGSVLPLPRPPCLSDTALTGPDSPRTRPDGEPLLAGRGLTASVSRRSGPDGAGADRCSGRRDRERCQLVELPCALHRPGNMPPGPRTRCPTPVLVRTSLDNLGRATRRRTCGPHTDWRRSNAGWAFVVEVI